MTEPNVTAHMLHEQLRYPYESLYRGHKSTSKEPHGKREDQRVQQIEELKRQLNALKVVFKTERDALVKKSAHDISSNAFQIARLKSDKYAFENAAKEMKEELRKGRSQNKLLTTQVANLEKEIEIKCQDIADLNSQILELKSAIESQKQNSISENTWKVLNTNFECLQEQNKGNLDQIDQLKDKLVALSDKLKKSDDTSVSLKKQHSVEIDALRNQVRDLEAEKCTLIEELSAASTINESLGVDKGLMDSCIKKLESSKASLKLLRDEIASIKTKQIDELESMKRSFRIQMENKEIENEQLKSDMLNSLQKKDVEINNLKEKNMNMKVVNMDLQSRLESLKTEEKLASKELHHFEEEYKGGGPGVYNGAPEYQSKESLRFELHDVLQSVQKDLENLKEEKIAVDGKNVKLEELSIQQRSHLDECANIEKQLRYDLMQANACIKKEVAAKNELLVESDMLRKELDIALEIEPVDEFDSSRNTSGELLQMESRADSQASLKQSSLHTVTDKVAAIESRLERQWKEKHDHIKRLHKEALATQQRKHEGDIEAKDLQFRQRLASYEKELEEKEMVQEAIKKHKINLENKVLEHQTEFEAYKIEVAQKLAKLNEQKESEQIELQRGGGNDQVKRHEEIIADLNSKYKRAIDDLEEHRSALTNKIAGEKETISSLEKTILEHVEVANVQKKYIQDIQREHNKQLRAKETESQSLMSQTVEQLEKKHSEAIQKREHRFENISSEHKSALKHQEHLVEELEKKLIVQNKTTRALELKLSKQIYEQSDYCERLKGANEKLKQYSNQLLEMKILQEEVIQLRDVKKSLEADKMDLQKCVQKLEMERGDIVREYVSFLKTRNQDAERIILLEGGKDSVADRLRATFEEFAVETKRCNECLGRLEIIKNKLLSENECLLKALELERKGVMNELVQFLKFRGKHTATVLRLEEEKEKPVDALQHIFTELIDEMKATSKIIANLEAARDKLSLKNKELSQEAQISSNLILNLQSNLQKDHIFNHSQVTQSTNAIKLLENQLQETNKQLKESNEQGKTMTIKFEHVSSKWKRTSEIASDLKHERDRLREDLNSLRDTLSEAESRIKAYVTTELEIMSRAEACKNVILRLENQIKCLQNDNLRLAENIESQKKVIELNVSELSAKSRTNKRLLQELEETNSILSSLRKMFDGVTKTSEAATAEKNRAVTQLKHLSMTAKLAVDEELESAQERFRKEIMNVKAREALLGREIEELAMKLKRCMDNHSECIKEKDHALQKLAHHDSKMKLLEAQALTQDNEIKAHIKRQLELEAELHSAEVKMQVELKSVKAEGEENFSRVKVKLEKEISRSKKYEHELTLTKKDLGQLRQKMEEQRIENLRTAKSIIQQTSQVHDRNSSEGISHREDILQLKTMLTQSNTDLKEKKALIIRLEEACEISRSLIDKLTQDGQVFLEKILTVFLHFKSSEVDIFVEGEDWTDALSQIKMAVKSTAKESLQDLYSSFGLRLSQERQALEFVVMKLLKEQKKIMMKNNSLLDQKLQFETEATDHSTATKRAEDQLEQFLYFETKAGELSSANTQLQRDLSNARDQIKLLEDHIRSYERSAESVLDGAYEQTLLFEGKWEDTQSQLGVVKNELEILKLEYVALKNENTENESKSERALNKIEESKQHGIQEIVRLKDIVVILEGKHEEILTTLEASRNKNTKLAKALFQTKSVLETLEQDYLQLRTEHHLKCRDLDLAQQDLKQLRDHQTELEGSISSIQKTNDATNSALISLQRDHVQQLTRWKNKFSSMDKTLSSTKKDLEQTKQALIVERKEQNITGRAWTKKFSAVSNLVGNIDTSKKVTPQAKHEDVMPKDHVKVNNITEVLDDISEVDLLIEKEKETVRLTSFVKKELQDVDHRLVNFMGEEESAEEELRRIHHLLSD